MNKRGLLIFLVILTAIAGCKEVSKSPTNDLDTNIIATELGNIDVSTEPQEANIYLDSNFIGKSPIKIENMPTGKHKITATKDGYQDASIDLEVYNQQTSTVSLILTKINLETTTKEETNEEITYKCFDTDGGIDFNIKGTTRVRQTICTYKNTIAACSSGYSETKRDDCNTTTTLYEYYCLGSSSKSVSKNAYDCQYGCEYGRCKPESQITTGYSTAISKNGNKIVALILFVLAAISLVLLLTKKRNKANKIAKKKRK